MHNIWEHIIAHYFYASGYAAMSVCIAWAYRDFVEPAEGFSVNNHRLAVLGALIYGCVIAGVGVNFVDGVVVVLVFVLVYGALLLGSFRYYLYVNSAVESQQKLRLFYRPILDYYLLSYVIAFFLSLIWISMNKGDVYAGARR